MARKKKNEHDYENDPNFLGTCVDGLGRTVYIFDGDVRIKTFDAHDFLRTGDQWCPDCHMKMIRKSDYWECPICFDAFTDADAMMDSGYPTYEASFKDDYGPPLSEIEGLDCIVGFDEDGPIYDWSNL